MESSVPQALSKQNKLLEDFFEVLELEGDISKEKSKENKIGVKI